MGVLLWYRLQKKEPFLLSNEFEEWLDASPPPFSNSNLKETSMNNIVFDQSRRTVQTFILIFEGFKSPSDINIDKYSHPSLVFLIVFAYVLLVMHVSYVIKLFFGFALVVHAYIICFIYLS